MAIRFGREGTGVVKDHNELENKGKRTHEEIDSYLDELDEARGLHPSIGDRLNDHEQRIGDLEDTQANQEDRLVDAEAVLGSLQGEIGDIHYEIIEARKDADGNEYATLKLRIDALEQKAITDIDGNEVLIRVRRMTSQELPNHAAWGEPILTTDTNKLYFGRGEDLPLMEIIGGGTPSEGSGLFTGIPVGTVMYFTSPAPPYGWLVCDGSEVSRTQYRDLFNVIGVRYGEGDGSTTFNLPDLRGEFIRGWDGGRGVDPNRAFGSWQADEFRSHTHNFWYYESSNTSGQDYDRSWDTSPEPQMVRNIQTDPAGGNETRPRNVALLPCIKYKQDAAVELSNEFDGNVVKIKVKRATAEEMPSEADEGEPIFNLSTGELFFGQGYGKPLRLVSGAGGGHESETLSVLKVKSASYNPVLGAIEVTVGAGRANINGTVVQFSEDVKIAIQYPEIYTVYYVFLSESGNLTYSTSNIESAGSMLLGSIKIGSAFDDIAVEDLRYFLTKVSIGRSAGGVGGVAFVVESPPFTRDEEQTVFKIPEYSVGTGALTVLCDGITLSKDVDYVETDNTTVTFLYPVPVEARITFKALYEAPDEVVVVDSQDDLPPNGDPLAIYLVRQDSSSRGKPTLYSFVGGKYEKISGGGKDSWKQYSVFDVEPPFEKDLEIEFNEDFVLPPVEVLKFVSGQENVVKNVFTFDEFEISKFTSDQRVQIDGVMKLKTSYVYEAQEEVGLDDGKMLVVKFDASLFKHINSIYFEVNG